MKFYFGKYKNNWLSPYTILEKVFFWRDIDYHEPVIEAIVKYLDPVCQGLQWVRNKVNPQRVYVKIDRWDVWSLDHTLANVILPSLKMLRDIKHGSPMVDEEDVPVHLQSDAYKKAKKRTPKKSTTRSDVHAVDMDNDSTLHERWEWVLGEMIWAFEQKMDDNAEDKFHDNSNAVGLPWEADYVPGKFDVEGYQAWQKRKDNGFRLFGKYYEALWT